MQIITIVPFVIAVRYVHRVGKGKGGKSKEGQGKEGKGKEKKKGKGRRKALNDNIYT